MDSTEIFLSRLREVLSWFHITTSAKKNILIIGLDASGKTTLINKLANGRQVRTETPTIGMHTEVLKLHELTFTTINMPCTNSDKTFTLTRHFYKTADAVIWVVPKNHSDCLGGAEHRLKYVFEHLPWRSTPLLVLCNKSESRCYCDENAGPAISLEQIEKQISMFENLEEKRSWQCFDIDLKDGRGLRKALEWLQDEVRNYSITHNCLRHLRSFQDILRNENF